MKNYYNRRTKELNGRLITSDLRQAADDFGNGKIFEVRDTILEIMIAIDNYGDDLKLQAMKNREGEQR